MMRAKYITEAPVDQPHGTLLDEYVRCAMDYHEGGLPKEEAELIDEYIVALRDEIVRRMREVF
jgi:hypothetical protein